MSVQLSKSLRTWLLINILSVLLIIYYILLSPTVYQKDISTFPKKPLNRLTIPPTISVSLFRLKCINFNAATQKLFIILNETSHLFYGVLMSLMNINVRYELRTFPLSSSDSSPRRHKPPALRIRTLEKNPFNANYGLDVSTNRTVRLRVFLRGHYCDNPFCTADGGGVDDGTRMIDQLSLIRTMKRS